MRLVAFFAIALLLIAALYQGGRWLERRSEKPEQRGDHTLRYEMESQIKIDGVAYRRKKGLTTILLMGIDRKEESMSASGYRNGGQADFLRLLVIDNSNKTITQIQIDRDTMTPITILDVHEISWVYVHHKSVWRTVTVTVAPRAVN